MKTSLTSLMCAVVFLASGLLNVQANSISLRVGEPNGKLSPNLIGYNMATNPPGSNVASFLRHSGADTIRVRLQARRAEDPALPDEGVATEEEFAEAREKFRKLSHAALKEIWTLPARNMDREKMTEIRDSGIEVLACVTYSPNNFNILNADGSIDWTMAWDLWRRYYAATSDLAFDYGINRLQIFNEPDHRESDRMSMDEYLVRMALASDAIQRSLEDEPSRGGPTLEPLISAPVVANIAAFGPRTGRPDTRDLERGWGEETLRSIHRKWNGTMDPEFNQFQQYAFQFYSMDPNGYTQRLVELADGIRRELNGRMLPVICTETNVRIARNYDQIEETQDSPTDFSALGGNSAVMAGGPLDEIYFFRMTLSDNLGDGRIKKNGTHYVSNQAPFHNIGGTTKSAEVIRLLATAFAGRQPLRQVEHPADLAIWSIATDNALWIASSSLRPARTFDIDLTSWNLQADDLLVLDEVSTRRHGDIASVLAPPPDGKLSLDIPGFSVTRIRVLREVDGRRKIDAARNFTIKLGDQPSTAETLAVGHRTGSEAATQLVYAGFESVPAGATVLANISAENPNEEPVFLHLYALGGDLWSANDESFPHLAAGVRPGNEIEPRIINKLGEGAEFAGTVLVAPGTSTVSADLTPVLARFPDQPVGLLVVREPRFSGDAGERGDVLLTTAPALELLPTKAAR